MTVWGVFCPAVDSLRVQTAAETVQLQRWRAAIRTLLTGKEKKPINEIKRQRKAADHWVCREAILKRMKESDALRGLTDPKVTTLSEHKCSVTFLPSAENKYPAARWARRYQNFIVQTGISRCPLHRGQHRTVSVELTHATVQKLWMSSYRFSFLIILFIVSLRKKDFNNLNHNK